MANSAFSGLRSRLGSGGRGRQDRYDRYDERGYDDYGEYADYGNRPGDPYDDIDDVSGIGEVRTRTVGAADSRYHPPLLSFDEARKNTYVPDRLLRDPLDRLHERRAGFEHPGSRYTPRVRDSVNMGRSLDHDPASPVPDDATAPVGAAAPMSSSAGYDPYASFQGAGSAVHTPTRKLKVISPVGYGEVESIARALKAGDVVVLGLTRTPGELAKRVLDFSFGVASALDACVDCAADKVFVISRGQGLTDLERVQLQAQGIIL